MRRVQLVAGFGALGLLLGTSAALAATGGPDAHEKPWNAAPSTTILQESRTFRSGDATLSGTLYLPAGARPRGAIVVFHGASSPLRSSPLYTHLKEMLPPLGVAVFVYDRRGAGLSGGDLKTSGYPMLADDGIAAVGMLAKDPRIDPKRIGVWGLSQGGWLSLLAASRDPQIAFAVSISAPVVTPDVQMMFSSTNSLRVNGYGQGDIDEMIATRKAVDDYMRGTGDRATAQSRLDAAKIKPWFKYLYMDDKVGDRATSRWRKEIEHDPLATLKSVRAPTLVIFGATDPVVPVAASVERIHAFSRTHPKLNLVVVASADHGMQTAVSAKTLLDPANKDAERPDAPEYFGLLASWLTRIGVARQ